MDTERVALEAAIVELQSLIEFTDSKEEHFQDWFERHPVVFDILGYVRGLSKIKLLLEDQPAMIPDFVAQRPDGLWEIVELKRPDTSILRNPDRRTVFLSEMGTYIAQCQEYSERCSQDVTRRLLANEHAIRINSLPSCLLVAGRSEGLDRFKVHELLKRSTVRITHYTYDDVLEALKRRYTRNYSGGDGRGVSVYAGVQLEGRNNNDEEFILDIGDSSSRNRISLVRFGDALVALRIFDNEGMRTFQDVDISQFSEGNLFACGIHIVHELDSVAILFEVNGAYVAEHRLARGQFVVEHPASMVVGADLMGHFGASMIFSRSLLREPPLDITERWVARAWLFEAFSEQTQDGPHPVGPKGVRFSGDQFLYTEGHAILDPQHARATNLVQRDDAKRPILV